MKPPQVLLLRSSVHVKTWDHPFRMDLRPRGWAGTHRRWSPWNSYHSSNALAILEGLIQPPKLRHFHPASHVMSCVLCPSASSITSLGVR